MSGGAWHSRARATNRICVHVRGERCGSAAAMRLPLARSAGVCVWCVCVLRQLAEVGVTVADLQRWLCCCCCCCWA